MANRSRSYYREVREKTIARKRRIIDSYRIDNIPNFLSYDEVDHHTGPYDRSYGDIKPYWMVVHDGSLSKGKIHCSCFLCAFHEVPICDQKRLSSMADELEDFYETDLSYGEIPGIRSAINKIKKRETKRFSMSKGYKGTSVHHSEMKDLDGHKVESFSEMIQENVLCSD